MTLFYKKSTKSHNVHLRAVIKPIFSEQALNLGQKTLIAQDRPPMNIGRKIELKKFISLI